LTATPATLCNHPARRPAKRVGAVLIRVRRKPYFVPYTRVSVGSYGSSRAALMGRGLHRMQTRCVLSIALSN